MRSKGAMVLAAAIVLASGTLTRAQDEAATTLEDIVVVARRSGAPTWEIRNGDSVVIIVGALSAVPRDIVWRPEALEAAVLQADSIVDEPGRLHAHAPRPRPSAGWRDDSGLS